jgi:hypothetical protein
MSQADSALVKTALEQRYLQLLELRVAQLEAIVSEGDNKVSNELDITVQAY